MFTDSARGRPDELHEMTIGTFVVYDWLTKPGFLIHSIVGSPAVLQASVRDSADHVFTLLPPQTSHFLFHLNCTITDRFPAGRAGLIAGLQERGVRLLNERATNITKVHIQERCRALGLPTVATTRDDGSADDLVIVKSNLNYGGANEWGLSTEERELVGVGAGSDFIYQPNHYLVMARRDVKPAWWEDHEVVCERFVANAEGHWYRGFVLFNRFVLCQLQSPERVKKVGGSTLLNTWFLNSGNSAEAPSGSTAALAFRDMGRISADMGLDFGAIDAVIDDQGVPHIIDVNTTPAYYSPAPGLADHLRGALEERSHA